MDTTILKRTVPERASVPSTLAMKVGIIEVTGIYLVMHMLTFGMLSIDSIRDSLSPIMVLMPLVFFLMCLAFCRKTSTESPKEQAISKDTADDPGLLNYISGSLGEYLTEAEIQKMYRILCRIRGRAGDMSVAEIAVCIKSDECLSAHYAERKTLKKYNLYAFVHNMCGYLHITRKEAAVLLKAAFPGIFRDSKVMSIDKSLTAEKDMRKLDIPYLESNSEAYFMEYIENLNNQNTI